MADLERACPGVKGYDDGRLIRRLWDGEEILPVIDIKEMWKEPDPTRVLPDRRRIVYDQHGAVYCHCPKTERGFDLPSTTGRRRSGGIVTPSIRLDDSAL